MPSSDSAIHTKPALYPIHTKPALYLLSTPVLLLFFHHFPYLNLPTFVTNQYISLIMPSSPLSPKSKTKTVAPTAEGDHRKRRRNRTTQSCVNCYKTKRMCDRQRPCSRCSQLGLSGNCVYEVDDPSRQGKQDEETRLMSRIAELEGVIRELKNKPHPRWLEEKNRTSGGSDGDQSSSHSSRGPSTPNVSTWGLPPSSRSSPPNFHFAPAGARPPSEKDGLESLLSMYAGLSEHMYIRRGGICGCFNDTECYNTVLELSARLRRAAEVLACSPSHVSSTCTLATRVSALDTLIKDSLLDTSDCFAQSTASSMLFDQQYSNNESAFSWELDTITGFDDGFMSWMPPRTNAMY
ncbi:hypothetical protein B0H16DRAFT_1542922 [Mycena metata]|uniref:Zn(2)-C6 fungal-type domain-containing protein n=1 Tax=Mycena metata TaxID=1033252 RepID=A0AAD7NCL4_9AGAR|nr:hypothetical protein B0H16DRAFT_1542922 [Mycena metata]